jgi:hypothetical protein
VNAQVEFVIVGGLAAVLHGATYVTRDLDIAAPFDSDNLTRLWSAIRDLRPRWATVPGTPPAPESAGELAGFRNLYLLTDWGRLDVLGETPPLTGYEELRRNAVVLSTGATRAPVICLADLIRIKEALPRAQDRFVAEQLRAIRDRGDRDR